MELSILFGQTLETAVSGHARRTSTQPSGRTHFEVWQVTVSGQRPEQFTCYQNDRERQIAASEAFGNIATPAGTNRIWAANQ